MSDRGSTAVEFLLLLPVFILLVMTILEVASVARLHVQVAHAAREGARAAATMADPAEAIAAATSALGAAGVSSKVTVERSWVVGSPATVRVEVPYRFMARLLGGVEVLVQAGATMRVEG